MRTSARSCACTNEMSCTEAELHRSAMQSGGAACRATKGAERRSVWSDAACDRHGGSKHKRRVCAPCGETSARCTTTACRSEYTPQCDQCEQYLMRVESSTSCAWRAKGAVRQTRAAQRRSHGEPCTSRTSSAAHTRRRCGHARIRAHGGAAHTEAQRTKLMRAHDETRVRCGHTHTSGVCDHARTCVRCARCGHTHTRTVCALTHEHRRRTQRRCVCGVSGADTHTRQCVLHAHTQKAHTHMVCVRGTRGGTHTRTVCVRAHT